MRNRPRILFWAFYGLILLMSAGLAFAVLWFSSTTSLPLVLLMLGAGLVLAAALAMVWVYLDLRLLGPVNTVSHNLEIGLHTEGAGDPVPTAPLLGKLATVAREQQDALGRCRREMAAALVVGGERQQSLVRHLEAVLREVDQAVVVCDAHSRVVLYNPGAQRLFHDEPRFGLGQSLQALCPGDGLGDGLKALRAGGGQGDGQVAHVEFLCSGGDDHLLRCRMSLLRLDEAQEEQGFVIGLEDRLPAQRRKQRRDALLRRALDSLQQGAVANPAMAAGVQGLIGDLKAEFSLTEGELSPTTKTDPQSLPPRPEFHDFDLLTRAQPSESQRDSALLDLDFVVFDTETTGLHPSEGDALVSIAGVRVVNGRLRSGETFAELIHPGRPIPASSTRFHGITDAMVTDCEGAADILPRFREFVGDSVLVAHNAAFDMAFLRRAPRHVGVDFSFDGPVLDTLLLSVYLHEHTADHTLDGLARRFEVEQQGRHQALGDALVTAEVFLHLLEILAARDIRTLGNALEVSDQVTEIRRRQRQFD